MRSCRCTGFRVSASDVTTDDCARGCLGGKLIPETEQDTSHSRTPFLPNLFHIASESIPRTHRRNALSKAVYPMSAARVLGPSTGNPAAMAMFPARFRSSCTPLSTIPTASQTTPPNSGCCEDSTVRFRSSTSSTVVSTTASLLPYSTPNACNRMGNSPILTLSSHRNVSGRNAFGGSLPCSALHARPQSTSVDPATARGMDHVYEAYIPATSSVPFPECRYAAMRS